MQGIQVRSVRYARRSTRLQGKETDTYAVIVAAICTLIRMPPSTSETTTLPGSSNPGRLQSISRMDGVPQANRQRSLWAEHSRPSLQLVLKVVDLKKYRMSAEFQKQFDWFFCQLKERDSKTFGKCDLELVALSSKKNFRKGLGTALVTQFLKRAEADGAECVRLFTNTLASWKFYEKSGFSKVSEKPFKDNSGNKSFVYEYILRGSEKDVGKRSE